MAVETSEYVGMMRRCVRALGRRAADGDLDALAAYNDLAELLSTSQAEAARDARVNHGFSWTEIGDALGVSRQAARQRFGLAAEQAAASRELAGQQALEVSV